jgi:trimeric autotransporter adhesin
MMNTRILGRMGLLAVGCGVGIATAPGMASADPATDWWSDLLGGLAVSAPSTPSDLNLAISIDGIQLLQDGTATANSGTGDIAIAYGDGAVASAVGGIGDTAIAGGTDASALAGGLSGDTGTYANNYDTAIDIGSNNGATTDGAQAGNFDLYGLGIGPAGTGSHDTAIDVGNNTGQGIDGAFATSGAVHGPLVVSNYNTAIDVGNNSGLGDSATAGVGDGNYASQLGNLTTSFDGADAFDGNNNIAVADASGGDLANAGQGNDNIAYILDPFGTTSSSANAGGDISTVVPNNSDLAAVLLTDGNATATGADNIYDIITALGNESGSAAATSGGFLGELLSLF